MPSGLVSDLECFSVFTVVSVAQERPILDVGIVGQVIALEVGCLFTATRCTFQI